LQVDVLERRKITNGGLVELVDILQVNQVMTAIATMGQTVDVSILQEGERPHQIFLYI
jgi:hypothetical protein